MPTTLDKDGPLIVDLEPGDGESVAVEIETSHWDLPTTSTAGYGSNLVRVPGTTSVLSTLPGGRMYLCDVLTGAIRTGQRLAGELRAFVFDGAHVDRAAGAWALTTFGLCRISLASLTRTGENIRQGLGKYQGRMVALSHDVFGISSFYGRSLILVSRHDGTVLKRLRMGAPALAYPLPDGRHRCWSPHNAVATDLDLASARCAARHPLPYGKGPVLIGDQVLALTGEREDMPGVPNVWDVRSSHVTTFDAWTLTELHRIPAPEDSIEVLGTDVAGRILITSRRAVTFLTPGGFDVETTYQHHANLGGALLLPEHNCAVLQSSITTGNGLTVIRWK
jgi:hypothetical protein